MASALDELVRVLKDYFIPGSPLFLLFATLVGTILLFRARWVKWARLWFAVLLLAYAVMSTPATAEATVRWLAGGYSPIEAPGATLGADAIVVLSGGAHRFRSRGVGLEVATDATALRLLEAVRVYQLFPPTRRPVVIVTGSSASGALPASADEMRAELVTLGIPVARIVVERESRNTREHGVYVTEILRQRAIGRIVLVTSLTHMRRAALVFDAAGIDVVSSPAPNFSESRREREAPWRYLPSRSALGVSEAAVYDLAGTFYYWARGWIS